MDLILKRFYLKYPWAFLYTMYITALNVYCFHDINIEKKITLLNFFLNIV